MTEQERLDEIMRMAERYKMDEGRRRVPMLQAAEIGRPYGEPGTVADLRRPFGGAAATPNIDAMFNTEGSHVRMYYDPDNRAFAEGVSQREFQDSLRNPRSEQRPSIGELPEDRALRQDMSALLRGEGIPKFWQLDDNDIAVSRAAGSKRYAGNARAIPETPQAGPDLNEFAYVGASTPPITGYEAQFRPRLSTEHGQGPYPPLKAPGMLDPRTGIPVPAGYTYGDDGITRDPNGIPATVQYPTQQEIASDINSTVFPGGKLARSLIAGGARLPGMQAIPVLSKGMVPALKDLAASYINSRGERPEKTRDRLRAVPKLSDETDNK